MTLTDTPDFAAAAGPMVTGPSHAANRPYITTFAGDILVEAASVEEACERAITWGTRYLAETVAVPNGRRAVRFLPGREAAEDRFLVPLAGTMNRLGASQEAVDRHVARDIELVRHTGPYRYVTMGAFRVISGAPDRGAFRA